MLLLQVVCPIQQALCSQGLLLPLTQWVRGLQSWIVNLLPAPGCTQAPLR